MLTCTAWIPMSIHKHSYIQYRICIVMICENLEGGSNSKIDIIVYIYQMHLYIQYVLVTSCEKERPFNNNLPVTLPQNYL